MNKSKYLLLIFLTLVVFFIAVGFYFYLPEYTKTGRCYKTGTILSSEELRYQVIKNLLIAKMENADDENKYDIWVHTFLIARSLTVDDLIEAVLSKSLVNLPDEAVYPINTEAEIEEVDRRFLEGDFSIVGFPYGSKGGDVFVTSSQGIQAASLAEIENLKKRFSDGKRYPYDLTNTERAMGYGNYFFKIDRFLRIDLDCCRSPYRSVEDNRSTQEAIKKRFLDTVAKSRSVSKSTLVVSNCGNVLHRNWDGYDIYLF